MNKWIIDCAIFLYPHKLLESIKKVIQFLKSENIKRELKIEGNAKFGIPCWIHGKQYISIGNGFRAEAGLVLGAFDKFKGKKYSPKLVIGNNVDLGFGNRITCCNHIEIGNNVLCAGKVFITDHFHGEINSVAIHVPPIERELYSKGEVIIEDNVWIGEGVCILPGVHIGKGSIIGANAVVTKDIPSYVVAAGIPAKVQRNLKTNKSDKEYLL